MEAWDILGDVVLLLAAASMVGMLFERLGASSIIGCMVAGMLVGPGSSAGSTANPRTSSTSPKSVLPCFCSRSASRSPEAS